MASTDVPLDWLRDSSLPPGAATALNALNFHHERPSGFEELQEHDWKELLQFCDLMKITLFLAFRRGEEFPDWVRRRTDCDLANNKLRYQKQWALYDEIDAALRVEGLEYLLLKGFSHSPEYAPQPWLRHQCDLDLFHPGKESAEAAQKVLEQLGLRPVGDFDGFPMDHLPAMMRSSDHVWRGDFFDPEVGIAVEAHFRWWDEETEQLPADGVDLYWDRRTRIDLEGRSVPTLAGQDRVSYAALHALRHILRGDARACHIYEIAEHLERTASDDAFWAEWADRQSPEVRRYTATLFETARLWFGCRVADRIREEIEELPPAVKQWHSRFVTGPMESWFRPNKDEIWLHLALQPAGTARWPVVSRKILPHRLPTPALQGAANDERRESPVRETLGYAGHIGNRAAYHLRALPRLAGQALGRMLGEGGLSTSFWTYLAAASLYHLGLFVFVLLYNLRLVELGYDEGLVGAVTSAMTVGSIAGAIPAGWFAQRIGLHRALLTCFVAVPLVGAARTLATGEAGLMAAAFAAGIFFSVWVVCIGPVISGLVREEVRPRAFSIFFAASIAMGVVGGFLGGRLPDLAESGPWTGFSPLQVAALTGCAITASAVVPGLFVRGLGKIRRPKNHYPRSEFIRRYLPTIFVWNLAVGAFNPFFNIYATEYLRMSLEETGDLFATGQMAQVAALLAAPILLRRLGTVRGIALLQAAAGGGLLLMAARNPLWLAPAAYALYMSFQWMSEPGLHTLLMSRVRETQRTGASALSYTTVFAAHAAAAGLAGWAIERWDYAVVLSAAAGTAVLAGVLFRAGLGQFDQTPPAEPADDARTAPV